MIRRILGIATIALMTVCNTAPANANVLASARAAVTCNGYTIVVQGFDLHKPSTVTYKITLTSNSGAQTVSGAIPVKPDQNGHFQGTQSQTWAHFGIALNSAYNLSGTATLLSSGSTVNIVFSPSSLSCFPCPGAHSNLIGALGAAGPTNFTVLSLGGSGADVNINLAAVSGNVGVPNPGAVQESHPSSVSGDFILGSGVSTKSITGSYGGIVVDDSLLASAAQAAENAASQAAALPTTPAVQAQFPANGQITSNLTVTGTKGLNVVDLPSFGVNGGDLTLTGPAGTAFVINVAGDFNLHHGNIYVSGGVGSADVLYNVTNPNATVTTMVPTTGVGILLAPNNTINSMDSSAFTGEVIGGYGHTITLMSGTRVHNPCE